MKIKKKTLIFNWSMVDLQCCVNFSDVEQIIQLCIYIYIKYIWASLVAQMVKNLPAVWEIWVPLLCWKDPLEEGVATHSSILAWRIPRTEEPGGLQSMWSQRVGHNWATKHTHTHTHKHVNSYIYILFRLFFLIGYYKILNRVPSAIQ